MCDYCSIRRHRRIEGGYGGVSHWRLDFLRAIFDLSVCVGNFCKDLCEFRSKFQGTLFW